MLTSEVDFSFPSDALLSQCLAELLVTGSVKMYGELPRDGARGCAMPDVKILLREPLLVAGSHPMERVILEVDGRREDLCCKYGKYGDPAHFRHGHRHGTAYEASVYEQVLRPLDVSATRSFGLVDKDGWKWLVTDYLHDSVTVSRTGEPGALEDAGRWLGNFHRQTEGLVASGRASFLYRQTAEYYWSCAQRTLQFAQGLPRPRPWLAKAARRYRRRAVPLLASQQTIIHGEFYSSNVLYRDGEVLPIDWESAGIGAPEIDVAFLLEGWSEEERNGVLEAYIAARWGTAPPPDFGDRLDAAIMFAQFRWLGDRPEWTADPENHWRFRILRESIQHRTVGG